MSVLKRIGRHPAVRRTLGWLFARYLGLVRRTSRIVLDPADAHARFDAIAPAIVAAWHGQHFHASYFRRPADRVVGLVSRSGDGELNALALEHLGVRAIRGSGDRGRGRLREKGGAQALRLMLRALEDGETVVLTADVPKIARRAGEGVVTLARLSGRPILPLAVVPSRRLVFRSWDRACLGLPFGRVAIVAGEPIRVERDATPAQVEAARLAVERGLDAACARAHAIVGATDPLERAPAPAEAAG